MKKLFYILSIISLLFVVSCDLNAQKEPENFEQNLKTSGIAKDISFYLCFRDNVTLERTKYKCILDASSNTFQLYDAFNSPNTPYSLEELKKLQNQVCIGNFFYTDNSLYFEFLSDLTDLPFKKYMRILLSGSFQSFVHQYISLPLKAEFNNSNVEYFFDKDSTIDLMSSSENLWNEIHIKCNAEETTDGILITVSNLTQDLRNIDIDVTQKNLHIVLTHKVRLNEINNGFSILVPYLIPNQKAKIHISTFQFALNKYFYFDCSSIQTDYPILSAYITAENDVSNKNFVITLHNFPENLDLEDFAKKINADIKFGENSSSYGITKYTYSDNKITVKYEDFLSSYKDFSIAQENLSDFQNISARLYFYMNTETNEINNLSLSENNIEIIMTSVDQ